MRTHPIHNLTAGAARRLPWMWASRPGAPHGRFLKATIYGCPPAGAPADSHVRVELRSRLTARAGPAPPATYDGSCSPIPAGRGQGRPAGSHEGRKKVYSGCQNWRMHPICSRLGWRPCARLHRGAGNVTTMMRDQPAPFGALLQANQKQLVHRRSLSIMDRYHRVGGSRAVNIRSLLAESCVKD